MNSLKQLTLYNSTQFKISEQEHKKVFRPVCKEIGGTKLIKNESVYV